MDVKGLLSCSLDAPRFLPQWWVPSLRCSGFHDTRFEDFNVVLIEVAPALEA